jgi:hypothetical protein
VNIILGILYIAILILLPFAVKKHERNKYRKLDLTSSNKTDDYYRMIGKIK